ncbi:hypothetical protein C8F01DRAFT_1320025 [Mycena amicta]|nr:hypothetical protein C8F01DRAFT_1320025 [Mycena amicta]
MPRSPFYSAVDLGCLLNYLLAPARAKHEITELAAYRGLGKGSKEEWSHSHEPNGWLAQMTKAVATHPRAAMAGSKAKAKASTRSSAPKPIPLPGVPSSVAQDVKQLAADYAQFITVEGVAALYRKHHSADLRSEPRREKRDFPILFSRWQEYLLWPARKEERERRLLARLLGGHKGSLCVHQEDAPKGNLLTRLFAQHKDLLCVTRKDTPEGRLFVALLAGAQSSSLCAREKTRQKAIFAMSFDLNTNPVFPLRIKTALRQSSEENVEKS